LCGVFSGALVVYAKITPFIATLGVMGIAQGLAYLVQNGTLVVISNQNFLHFFTGNLLGIPKPVLIFVAIAAVFGAVMRWTAFGRQLYAIGGNAEAARLSGLPVKRNKLAAYCLSGMLASVAGLMLAAQLAEGNSLLGRGLELDAIAAAVVGGASLFGGLGSPVAAVLGGLLIGTITNIMDLRSVQAEPQLIIKGLLILLAVYFTSGAGADLRKDLPALLFRRQAPTTGSAMSTTRAGPPGESAAEPPVKVPDIHESPTRGGKR
jgi:ribose transport system permease protein